MDNTLGNKIKQLRKQKNISQEVLAQYLGVSFQAVSKWETGTTMPEVLQEDPEAQCLTESEIEWRQEMLVKIGEKLQKLQS